MNLEKFNLLVIMNHDLIMSYYERNCLGLLIEPAGTNLINCSGSSYGSDAISGSNLGNTMQINTVEQVERQMGLLVM